MRRNNSARLLTWIFGAWLVSWGLLVAAPASAAACSPARATSGAQHAVELALSAPSQDALGGDQQSVLDDRDPSDTDAPTLSGDENTQPFAPVAGRQHRRVVLPAPVRHFDSISPVEPRFLRYSRLLI